jgi:hypothetical protein
MSYGSRKYCIGDLYVGIAEDVKIINYLQTYMRVL